MTTVHSQTDYTDLEAVKQTLGYYMDGASNGDKAMFTKAFLPEGQMIFIRDGETTIVPLKDFVARMKDGQKSDRKNRIVSIQIEGEAAQARLRVETPELVFHDFMSLLKTKDGWKIVSKIFYREDK
ncbi:MAG: nuclear transport factor 2 family protein [Bacteroidota bacterium]